MTEERRVPRHPDFLTSMNPTPLILLFALTSTSAILFGEESPRTRVRFDDDWRFARFGLQADGTRVDEPGGERNTIQLSASSEESERGNLIHQAMDGNPSTRWCASGPEGKQWLALNFGQPTELGSIRIQWDVTAAWKEKRLPYGFLIEASMDAQSWTTLADHSATTSEANPVTIPLKGTWQHLRVRTTSVLGTQWASIREIQLTDASGKPIENRLVSNGQMPAISTFDDSNWRKLDLPHDWGIEGPFRLELAGETGKLPWRGIGWYRKHFKVPSSAKSKRVFVDFDGAMAHAKVYCNGALAGAWPYGYNSFRVDLTDHLKLGEDNVLAVRLDTEKWDSRWYPGAGIYRHVWMVSTDPVSIGHWGTYLTTPEVSADSATVKLAVTLENATSQRAKAEVSTELLELNANGQSGGTVGLFFPAASVEIAAAGQATVHSQAPVAKPKLWDLEHPHRYLARTTVRVDGKVTDVYDTPFGIRSIEATPRDGFKLNGKRVEFKGVCMHHDLGALGAALNDRALERQVEILKSMGCNAWRTSHNPPAPELMEICDRLGMLVLDEAFDAWAKGKRPNDYNKLYPEWHEKDLQALVHRDRNHPSVIMWSIGNEVMNQQDVAMTKHLADIVRREDPTRPITNGYNDPNGGRGSGAAQALDVMGVNYFFDQQPKWDADPRYEKMPTMGSETSSCVSTRGEYFFGTHRSNWQVSSYDRDRPGWGCDPDTQFRTNRRLPHLLGEFVWTGFDYLGEPTPYLSGDNTQLLNFRTDPVKRAQLEKELAELAKTASPSRSSYFGIIDTAGFPKDRFYLYQAHWRPELPMAHILPHWNWPERVGQKTPVHVYTSGDSAELFLNGKSLGKKARKPGEDFRLVWDDVVYQPGELKVQAFKDGKPWAEADVKTTGAAAKLSLAADRNQITADHRDLSFITVRVSDSAGITVPRSHNDIRFSINGPGEIVAVDNGDPTSFEPFQASRRKAFNGLALVMVRAKKGESGSFVVTAESPELAPASVTVHAK